MTGNNAVSLSSRYETVDEFWRAATYTSVALLYLKNNVLLRRRLDASDIKERIVGHWGCVGAVNFVYAHMLRVRTKTDKNIHLNVGTGHAGPSLLACTYLDGSLGETDPMFGWGECGLERLCRAYGEPGGFLTELSARIPGTISNNGELGYALSMSVGRAMGRPNSTSFCVIGDGEAETGATQSGFWARHFIEQCRDGQVIPVLNLNGWRMGGASLFGRLTDAELTSYFRALGWQPILCSICHEEFGAAIERSLSTNRSDAGILIILKSPKGFSGPEFDPFGERLVNSLRAHKAPLKEPGKDFDERQILENWLRSYRPEELFDNRGMPTRRIRQLSKRSVPSLGKQAPAVAIIPAHIVTKSLAVAESSRNSMDAVCALLYEIISNDVFEGQFRIFSPDELSSNRLGKIIDIEKRYVVEILNEQTCFAWQLGFVSAGGSSILVMYEGFATLIATMLCQHAKFLAESADIDWREPLPAVTIVLTSTAWTNVYSHQNPDLIGLLRLHEFPSVRIYTPINSQVTTVMAAEALTSFDCINLIVATKYPVEIKLSYKQIVDSKRLGWTEILSTPESGRTCDLIFISIGDVATDVMMAAVEHIRSQRKGLSIRSYGVSRPDALHDVIKHLRQFAPTAPVVITSIAPREALKIEMFGLLAGNNIRFFGFRDKVSGFNSKHTLLKQGMSPEQVATEALELLPRETSGTSPKFCQ